MVVKPHKLLLQNYPLSKFWQSPMKYLKNNFLSLRLYLITTWKILGKKIDLINKMKNWYMWWDTIHLMVFHLYLLWKNSPLPSKDFFSSKKRQKVGGYLTTCINLLYNISHKLLIIYFLYHFSYYYQTQFKNFACT